MVEGVAMVGDVDGMGAVGCVAVACA